MRGLPLPRRLLPFLRDTRGGNLVEYVILLGCIALLSLGAWRKFGGAIRAKAALDAELVAQLEGADTGGCLGGLCINGNCFVAGTRVATPDGERPIDELRVGDLVLARDERTGEVGPRRVVGTQVTPDMPLVDVRVQESGGEVLRATPGHRFWTIDRGWVEAAELAAGEPLLSAAGAVVHVESLAAEAAQQTVYNIEVEGAHTYFVGAARLLVHNPKGGCGGAGGGGSNGSGDNGGASGGGTSSGGTSSGATSSGGTSSGGTSSGGTSSGGTSSGGTSSGGTSSGGTSSGGGRVAIVSGPQPDGTFLTGTGQVLTGTAAQQATALRAAVEGQVAGLPKSGVVVAGVLDTTTGKVYYGTNANGLPSPLNPVLAPYVAAMQADKQHPSDPGTHAEIYAVNAALNARAAAGKTVTAADLNSLMVDTAWLRGNTPGGMNRGDPAPFCGNCQGIIPGVINLPGNAPPKK